MGPAFHGKFNYIAYLMVVYLGHHGHDQYDTQIFIGAVIYGLFFDPQQFLPPGFQINMIGQAVKLHEYRRETCFFQSFYIGPVFGQPLAVGVQLYVWKTHFSAHLNNLRQVVPDGRLPAGQLNIERAARALF